MGCSATEGPTAVSPKSAQLKIGRIIKTTFFCQNIYLENYEQVVWAIQYYAYDRSGCPTKVNFQWIYLRIRQYMNKILQCTFREKKKKKEKILVNHHF